MFGSQKVGRERLMVVVMNKSMYNEMSNSCAKKENYMEN